MKRFPKSVSAPTGAQSNIEATTLVVCFKSAKSPEEAAVIFQNIGLALVTSEKRNENDRMNRINHTPTRWWVKTADGSGIDDARLSAIEAALAGQIEWVGPVYSSGGPESSFCTIPDVVLISKSNKASRLASLSKSHGLTLDEKRSKYLTGFHYMKTAPGRAGAAFEVQAKLAKSGEEVHFERMPMIVPTCAVTPNDPWWGSQWDMAQIKAPEGWEIESGRASVVVAILDEGVDLNHPDLKFSEPGINLGWMGGDGSPTGNHGTACAGIAAATMNNNEGVAGVASGCSILPLAFSSWSDVECAMGINYATQHGASVISMSFGVYDSWGSWNYAVIDPEIQNAFNNNVVMCVAAGNENDGVWDGNVNRYPGRHPLVICVGGSSTDDNRKTPNSPDGENWWGASHGEQYYNGVLTGLSVVAPCVLCPTTDRLGWDGYTGDNYMPNFNGTSSATPHVAGLAALLKSQDQSRTNGQIREIIEKTAAKVGNYTYTSREEFPAGTWHQEMGYGRIDVKAALSYASPMGCGEVKKAAKLTLMQMALNKSNHVKADYDCPEFDSFLNPNGGKAFKVEPCFYLHWGDGPNDNIETEDFEVVILSVCNPFNNVEFRGVTLSDIEIVHADGTPVELLPDTTPSAMVVPSKLVSFNSIAAASCSNIELVVKTSCALEGGYKIRFHFCIEEVSLGMSQGDEAAFDLELVAS